jgi:general secretion pathway protein L
MTTLRVKLPMPFDPAADAAWWRVDERGRLVDRGRGPASSWPPADRREAVLGAQDVRIVALALPPMSGARLPSAAAFALEDQLAAPVESMHVAVEPARGGVTLARVVDRDTIDWLASHRPAFDRVVAEPDLVARDGAAHHYVDADGHGFVRQADGSAYAVDASAGPGAPWSVERAPPEAWSAAPDLRNGYLRDAGASRRSLGRALVPALALVGAAIALHVVATAAQWAHDRYVVWRADRAVVALAREAGLEPVPDASAAESLLARRAAATLHAGARMADGDALPLVARAAPALGALPAGSVRRIGLSERRIVADVGALDEARLARVLRDLANAGLDAVSAPIAGGVRISATIAP